MVESMRSAERSAGEKPGCCSYHLGQYEAHGSGRRRDGSVLGQGNACGWVVQRARGGGPVDRVSSSLANAISCNQHAEASHLSSCVLFCECASCVCSLCVQTCATHGRGGSQNVLSNPPRLVRNRGNQKRREKISQRGSAGHVAISNTASLAPERRARRRQGGTGRASERQTGGLQAGRLRVVAVKAKMKESKSRSRRVFALSLALRGGLPLGVLRGVAGRRRRCVCREEGIKTEGDQQRINSVSTSIPSTLP